MKHLKRLAVSCGGTGGHFLPGLSVAREFNRTGGECVLLLGGKHAREQSVQAGLYGIKSYVISCDYLTKNPVRCLRGFLKIIKGFSETEKILRKHHIQAVLSMGSFASFPPALAAVAGHYPLFLHDGNTLLGKMNLFVSRWAKKFMLSFPSVNQNSCRCPAVLTGFPLRPELLNGVLNKQDALKSLNIKFEKNFSGEYPVILIFGGSQGAKTLNMNFTFDAEIPGMEKIQIIHLTGNDDAVFDEVTRRWSHTPYQHLVLKSFAEMHILYSAADLVICRAGGSTVSELAYFGKYAVLVPFPFAAEHHQDTNARWLLQKGGGMILPDSEAAPARFRQIIRNWFENREEYCKKGLKSKELASPQASVNILNVIDNNIH